MVFNMFNLGNHKYNKTNCVSYSLLWPHGNIYKSHRFSRSFANWGHETIIVKSMIFQYVYWMLVIEVIVKQLIKLLVFSDQAFRQGFSLSFPSLDKVWERWSGGLLLWLPIEVMRKWVPVLNTCTNYAAESVVAAVGSMFIPLARDK